MEGNMYPRIRKILFFTALSIFVICSAMALPPEGEMISYGGDKSIDNTTFLDANQILMFVTNHGNIGRDLADVFGYGAGTFYPYFTTEDIESGLHNNYVVYASGLWMAGTVLGELRGAIAEYSDEFVPGPMASGTYQPDNPAFKVYKLYRDSLENNPNGDYLNWPVDQGAPVDDIGRPLALGEQTIWTVYNDADPAQHSNNNGETDPLGVEVKMLAWASPSDVIGQSPIYHPSEVNHTGDGAGSIDVKVVDPDALIERVYQLFIDGTAPNFTWGIRDLNTGAILIDGQTDFGGNVPAVVDGLEISVNGEFGLVPMQQGYEEVSGERPITWAGGAGDFEFEGLYGAMGYVSPAGFFWGCPEMAVGPYELKDIMLVFAETTGDGSFDYNDENVSFAYRYGRGFTGAPARPEFAAHILNSTDGGYAYQDFWKSAPLSAWDVSVDPPRRLAVGFLENNTYWGLVDGIYFPPYYGADTLSGDYDYFGNNTAGSGPREWLFIFDEDYSEIPNPLYQQDLISNCDARVMYWSTAARRFDYGFSGGVTGELDRVKFYHQSGLTSSDSFTFTTPTIEMVPITEEGSAVYMAFTVTNKGSNQIQDMYFSFWADPDLGGPGDDLVGCDTVDNLFFCYNNDNSDSQFGYTPPAVGYKLLRGPLVSAGGETGDFFGTPVPNHRNLGLTAFNKYLNGTDPDNIQETYNYMRGLNRDGTDYIYNGAPTAFVNSGDPVTMQGDIDIAATDRRMMATSGPFDMNPGDSQYVLIKMAVGMGGDRLESITKLREILNRPFEYPEPVEPTELINFVQWKKEDGGNDHWYGVYDRTKFWIEAKAAAESFSFDERAGYLATINSPQENDFIFEHVIQQLKPPTYSQEFWLGGQDPENDNQWTWITGEPFSYINWSPTEPNHPGVETVLSMWGYHNSDPRKTPGEWNNSLMDNSVNSDHQWWAVVEFGEPDLTTKPFMQVKQWKKKHGGNDHWYGIYTNPSNWSTVATYTPGFPFNDSTITSNHLATITSADENDFIANEILYGGYTISDWPIYWLGGHGIPPGWNWVTDEPFVYSNFNIPFIQYYSEKAIYIWGYQTGDHENSFGYWNFADLSDTTDGFYDLYSIIEWQGDYLVETIHPTNEWVSLYCGSPALDGNQLMPGDIISVFDHDDVLCGIGTVRNDGSLPFTPVYRDYEGSPLDEGAEPGEALKFKINDEWVMTSEPVYWTGMGDRLELCQFMTIHGLTLNLNSGWNLVSWNIDNDIEDVEDLLGGTINDIELIMGFNEVGLTYDPQLPQFSTLDKLDHHYGYWFKMYDDAELEIFGDPIGPIDGIMLNTGWNLISYWPETALPTTQALSDIWGDLVTVNGWKDGTPLTYDIAAPQFATLTEMEPGLGYWVNVTRADIFSYMLNPPKLANTVSNDAPDYVTRNWINLYSFGLTIDGSAVAPGTEVKAYDQRDRLIGEDIIKSDGTFGFMPVYGDDPMTEKIEGLREGDSFRLKVGEVDIAGEFVFSRDNMKLELGSLKAGENLPESFALYQNYPNPFNPSTSIKFSLPERSQVKLTVYDILGRKVAVLADDMYDAGEFTAIWDSEESGASSGVYFYRFEAGNFEESKKMILVK